MATCPTCGQNVPPKHRLSADGLLELLLRTDHQREVYKAGGGGWWVTYGGGETTHEAVQVLLDRGAIRDKYSDLKGEVYHPGQTIDMPATMERRKREGRKAPLVYIEQR